jgi:hypothetical protein
MNLKTEVGEQLGLHDDRPVLGSVRTCSSDERRLLVERFISEVLFPYRRMLLRSRELVWQSAFFDSDGYVAEVLSSLILGIPGVSRRGVTRSAGDLEDETEVKKGFRADPNIDFILSGKTSSDGWSIDIDSVPPELKLPEIIAQINANACSVQILKNTDGKLIGSDLHVTVSKNCFLPCDGSKKASIRLKKQIESKSSTPKEYQFLIRQERGHINFGNKSKAQLRKILESRPVFIFYGHNLRGGLQIVATRSGLRGVEIDQYLDAIYADSSVGSKRQVQPYLYPDNIRNSFYSSDVHSVATALKGGLLMVANERASGVSIDYWDPVGSKSVVQAKEYLIEEFAETDSPDLGSHLAHKEADLKMSQNERASWFFDECMVNFYRSIEPFCNLTSTTRNVGFGNMAQHLVGHVTGIRGTRSGARGADLVENDGSPSEVKLATGLPGDSMGTEDLPRLTLGWDIEKMLTWKRLFPLRIIDDGTGLRALAHAPETETMEQFKSQAKTYFENRPNNGSGGLQYHVPKDFPHDVYGTREKLLTFVRVADLCEGRKHIFLEVPVVENT